MANKKLRTVAVFAIIVLWTTFSLGAVSFIVHSKSTEQCDAALPAIAARKAGVGLPRDATVCRDPSVQPVTFISAKPSVLCRATGVTLDCPSIPREAILLTLEMADAGWDNETIDVSKDKTTADLKFRRKGAVAYASLRKARNGEIVGDITVHD